MLEQKIEVNLTSYETGIKFSLANIKDLIEITQFRIEDLEGGRDKYSYASMPPQQRFLYDYKIEQYQDTLLKLEVAKAEVEKHLNERCGMKFNKKCKYCSEDRKADKILRNVGIFTS